MSMRQSWKPASTNPFEFKSYCRNWIDWFENIFDHVSSLNMNSQSLGWWAYVHVLHFSLTNQQVPVQKALYRHLCRLVEIDFALYQPTQLQKLLATKARVSFSQKTEMKSERNSPQWQRMASFDIILSKLAPVSSVTANSRKPFANVLATHPSIFLVLFLPPIFTLDV